MEAGLTDGQLSIADLSGVMTPDIPKAQMFDDHASRINDDYEV
jgi:hypothetical protein